MKKTTLHPIFSLLPFHRPHVWPSAQPLRLQQAVARPRDLPKTDEENPDGCSRVSLISGGREQNTSGARSKRCIGVGGSLEPALEEQSTILGLTLGEACLLNCDLQGRFSCPFKPSMLVVNRGDLSKLLQFLGWCQGDCFLVGALGFHHFRLRKVSVLSSHFLDTCLVL